MRPATHSFRQIRSSPRAERPGSGAARAITVTPTRAGFGGYVLVCVMVLVTQGNRGRGPHGRLLSTPQSGAAAAGRAVAGGAGAGAPARVIPPCTGPADGINNERPVEYQGVLAGSLLP
jgi:hypothetical protein